MTEEELYASINFRLIQKKQDDEVNETNESKAEAEKSAIQDENDI